MILYYFIFYMYNIYYIHILVAVYKVIYINSYWRKPIYLTKLIWNYKSKTITIYKLRIFVWKASEKTLHSSLMISISKPLFDHDMRTIERTKEERFITTLHVWYRPSDLQKRARFFFPKMQIIPRLAGCSRCRVGINWEEWAGDGDDIQIRARRK